MEEGVSLFKPVSFVCISPPKSSAVVSSIAALENQMRMIDSTVSLNHSFGIQSLTNGFNDSRQLNTKGSLSEKRVESFSANSPNVSESSYSPGVSASPIQSNSEGMMVRSPAVNTRPESRESLAASVKREQPESPTSASAASAAQELRGIQPGKLCVKEETPYSTSLQLSRERGTLKCFHLVKLSYLVKVQFGV